MGPQEWCCSSFHSLICHPGLWRNIYSSLLPIFNWVIHLFAIELWEFFMHSGYKFIIRYVICTYFLPRCSALWSMRGVWGRGAPDLSATLAWNSHSTPQSLGQVWETLESYSSQREPAALNGELEGGSPVFLATPTWSRLFLLMTWRGRVKLREQVVSKTQTHTVPTVI